MSKQLAFWLRMSEPALVMPEPALSQRAHSELMSASVIMTGGVLE
jgi:hypothetical protein